jgi:hypothetical protein
VMYKVPAIILRTLWSQYKCNEPFPISFEYLLKLFSTLGDDYDINVRRGLGAVFNVVMKSDGAVKLGSLSTLMSQTSSEYSSVMRKQLMDLCVLIREPYAFLIPKNFCEFLHGIRGVMDDGQIEYDSRQISSGCTICPGDAYNVMGPAWLSDSKILQAIKNGKHRRNNRYLKALCQMLKSGRTPTEEEDKNLGFSNERSMAETLGIEQLSIQHPVTVHSAPNRHNRSAPTATTRNITRSNMFVSIAPK